MCTQENEVMCHVMSGTTQGPLTWGSSVMARLLKTSGNTPVWGGMKNRCPSRFFAIGSEELAKTTLWAGRCSKCGDNTQNQGWDMLYVD